MTNEMKTEELEEIARQAKARDPKKWARMKQNLSHVSLDFIDGIATWGGEPIIMSLARAEKVNVDSAESISDVNEAMRYLYETPIPEVFPQYPAYLRDEMIRAVKRNQSYK